MAGTKQPPPDELEIDRMAETELVRLQRQFRIMEGDRLAFAEETGAKLRKQRRVIKNLKDEREDLKIDLKVATSTTNKQKDVQITEQLKNMLNLYDQYSENIRKEKAHIGEIDEQIRKIEKDVIHLKSNQVTDAKLQARVLAAQRSVAQLENRLEVATKKFNIVLAENDKLRAEIDHLLKERAHFNHLWEKLIGNLNKGKKFMMDLIEQATIAYDQRDEWCNKLQALKDRGKTDLLHHTQEMRNMQRKIDHDVLLQEFLGTKGQRRVMADLEAREAAKRRQQREATEQQLAQYREILQKIREFSGEEDIDRLKAQFIKQEEENFALFNYVNELNNELEALNETVEELRNKIDEQKNINFERAEQQKFTLEMLQEKLNEHTKQADEAEAKRVESENKLNGLLSGVEKIFELVNCNRAPVLELLGDNKQVTIFNINLYLGILEKRINELVNSVYYRQMQVDKRKSSKVPFLIKDDYRSRLIVTPVEKVVPTQPCPLCVEQETVSEYTEVIQEPFDRDEVEIKLEEKLALPDSLEILHNVSACHLPKSRQIIQRRYQ